MGRRNLQSLKSLVKHLIFIALIVLGATGAWAQTPATRILDDIPVGWRVTAGGVEVTVTPYYTGSPLGSAIIPEGAEVVLTPPDSVKPRVKDVELLLPEQIPLTFEAKMAGAVVSFGRYYPDSPQPATVTIEYSKNGGEWTTYTSSITLDYVGDKVSFRGNNTTYYLNMFYCSGDCYLYGNIMSLISSEDYATATALTESYAFAGLFSLNSDIYNHASKKLVLPATTLSSGCYSNMFNGCTGLTAAPELPANTMDEYCYYEMFEGCSGLTIAPELPAEILAEGCYSNMFSGCTSLTHAPALPVETLAEECYTGMFYGCTSLTSAPALPAMTMTPHCYQGMFDGCSSLTTAPALPATTLATQCYNGMFSNCTSLATAPALPATTLAGFCYDGMFSGDTSLTTAPMLPAETLSPNCYQYMFMGCKNLNSVTCLATNISATNCTTDWLDNVAATGTFIKPASMTDWLIDNPSGIPPGWTVISDGALPGEFTVNADGRKVNFSQGNLQYQASTNTWRFAEHQYDAVGSDNSNVSPSYSGWIDLFGWGTGNQPTQTSTDPNAYPPFVNWGTNAISNGGNTANSWYTLSENEWTYLISSRPNASSKRGQATVNGIHCYVLLPDEWVLPSGLSFTSDANNWTTNVYTAEQWAQMEAAGAVCFPTAGSRAGGANNTDINNFNNWGSYWSSTAANGTQGYNLWFTDNHVGTTDVGNYQMGTSVRLAKTLLKQDAEGYYLIGSVQDWRDFAALVQAIPTANAKMTADIAVVTTMIGTEEHPYQGTFDGDGHKLTVNISCTGTQFVAPFHRVFGGSVKNLYVDGIVSSNHNHMSGLIGRATGSVSIENCVVAVNIRMGSDYAAGFVGNGGSIQYQDESFVVMTDCLFMGTFTGVGAKRNKIAGFYGWGASTPAFINCLENGFFENTGTDHVPYLYEGTDENNPTSSSNSYYKHGSMSLSWATNASNMNNAELVAGLGNNWVTDPVINQPMLKTFANGGYECNTINYKLPGAFSVSDNKVVCFSQGNLQYKASTQTWRFAEHQYDYVGDATHGNVYENEVKCDNANISSTYSGWIDLFGWATSGNGSSGTAYQPWSTSTTNSDYGPAISSGEWTAANSDWGVVNAVQLGSGWRTLTHSEWAYLINSRTNASSLRTFATVNGVVGLILMPDGWTANGVSLTITTNNYTSNNLSLAQWSTLESQGCVFLPSDGYRGGNNGTTLDLVQDHGSYWSSTAASDNTPHAYYLDVKTSGLDPNYQNNRHIGLSVRLVSETYFVGSGTEADPYIIHSEADWNYLAAKVNSGTNYAGKFFRQTADIDVTTMVGISDSKPFSGTYNGDGKTLNLNLSTSESHAAPFRYIVDATIQNVVTTGSVYSTSYHPSGLVGITDGTCTIQNCRVSANVGGPQYLGGIVGHCWHADISIIGCVYTGTLNPASGQKTGGILGWGGDGGGHTITISNCLFAGSLANTSTKFNPIGDLYDQNMYGPNTKNLSNTYYTLDANIPDDDNNSFVKGLSYKGKFARSITAGTDVTVANAGAATVYDVSGITSYGTGILYDGVLYAGNGEAVSLTLSHADAPEGFFFTQYTVTGGGTLANPTTNNPTLTMTDANQVINAQWTSQTFNYTGAVQTFTVPATGYYTLTCYGAQGGTFVNEDGLGGLGGTSQITYYLTAGTVLYVYVGGQGQEINSVTTDSDTEGGAGGWNGGGKGGTGARWHGTGALYRGGSGGGGATHIATNAIGPITSSTDFTANHVGLLLIAGGGGGGTGWGIGGEGGGAAGEKGSSSYVPSWSIVWNNATYSCGRDGEVSSTGSYSCCGCGGGGGGFQGGNTWHVTSSTAEYESYSGAGGSSWGETTYGINYSTTTGGATAGGNGKAVITWYGTTYPSE